MATSDTLPTPYPYASLGARKSLEDIMSDGALNTYSGGGRTFFEPYALPSLPDPTPPAVSTVPGAVAPLPNTGNLGGGGGNYSGSSYSGGGYTNDGALGQLGGYATSFGQNISNSFADTAANARRSADAMAEGGWADGISSLGQDLSDPAQRSLNAATGTGFNAIENASYAAPGMVGLVGGMIGSLGDLSDINSALEAVGAETLGVMDVLGAALSGVHSIDTISLDRMSAAMTAAGATQSVDAKGYGSDFGIGEPDDAGTVAASMADQSNLNAVGTIGTPLGAQMSLMGADEFDKALSEMLGAYMGVPTGALGGVQADIAAHNASLGLDTMGLGGYAGQYGADPSLKGNQLGYLGAKAMAAAKDPHLAYEKFKAEKEKSDNSAPASNLGAQVNSDPNSPASETNNPAGQSSAPGPSGVGASGDHGRDGGY